MRLSFLLVPLGMAMASIGAAQSRPDYFPDTPDNHWVYETIGNMKKMGFAPSEPDGFFYHAPPRTKLQVATSIKDACAGVRKVLLQMQTSNDGIAGISQLPGVTRNGFDSHGELSEKAFAIGSLCREIEKPVAAMVKLFTPQFRQLNADPTLLSGEVRRNLEAIATFRVAQPGEAKQLFADVPANHWATDALRNLRAEGILRGYPGGFFGE